MRILTILTVVLLISCNNTEKPTIKDTTNDGHFDSICSDTLLLDSCQQYEITYSVEDTIK